MRAAIHTLSRYIVTPEVAKHRIFRWAHPAILPDCKLMVIARDDDTCFGILHSRFHELWSLAKGGWHGVGNDPRYTPSSTFETFPFPEGLGPDAPAADYAADPRARRIADGAKKLDEMRNTWLNPTDLVRRVPEVVAGFVDRLLAIDDKAAAVLKQRTLTSLYNARPTWLANAHRDLDEAVAAAYGWPSDMSDEEVLSRLLALNHAQAGARGSHNVGS